MGHVIHHAIIVTSCLEGLAREAHGHAIGLRCSVTPLIRSPVNREWTFLIGPDGSKSGWPASDLGDEQRDRFITWTKKQRYEDGSSSLHWVEVSYSSDDEAAQVERHEWDDRAVSPTEDRTSHE